MRDAYEGMHVQLLSIYAIFGYFLGVVYLLQFSLASEIGEKTGVLEWLLRRLMTRKFDANKLYSAEVLSQLLQADMENVRRAGGIGSSGAANSQLGVSVEGAGVEALLMAISYYKKRDPKGGEEQELVETLFVCLNTLLVSDTSPESACVCVVWNKRCHNAEMSVVRQSF